MQAFDETESAKRLVKLIRVSEKLVPLEDVVETVRKGDNVALVRLLAKAGDGAKELVNAKTATNSRLLIMACGEGKTDLARTLLDAGADAELVDMYQGNAFFACARNGHAATVRLFLGRSANPSATRRDGWTALHAAARSSSSAETVSLLIAAGADPAAVAQADVPGREPLQAPASVLDIARRGGCAEVIEAVEAALAAAARSGAGNIAVHRNTELEPSARGVCSADARVRSADGAIIGSLAAGDDVCVRSVGPDWCSIVVGGQPGFITSTCCRFRLLVTGALGPGPAAVHRRACQAIAQEFDQQLVWNALREGRTFAHLSLKYDFEADGAQFWELNGALAAFAARHRSLQLQFVDAGAFDDSVAFLDVSPQPTCPGAAQTLCDALHGSLRQLSWMDWSKDPAGGAVHWHATVAMGFDAAARSARVCERTVEWLRANVSLPSACAFELGSVTVMAKSGSAQPYLGTAQPVLTFDLTGKAPEP